MPGCGRGRDRPPGLREWDSCVPSGIGLGEHIHDVGLSYPLFRRLVGDAVGERDMGAVLEDEVLGVITGDKIRIGRNQGVERSICPGR